MSLASRSLYVCLVDNSVDECANFVGETKLVYELLVFILRGKNF